MITGFNTDVQHDGCVYHVQTEDRGRDHRVLESLVYIGGTIIAKKLTSYDEQLKEGASEEAIAGLLRRQHQVMIAAIKAGRVEDLIRHSETEHAVERVQPAAASPPGPEAPTPPPVAVKEEAPQPQPVAAISPARDTPSTRGGLNLDQVISDYLKRSAEQGRLDLKVLSPAVFTAGKSVNLKIEIQRNGAAEAEAIVTVKIIGTAFKPQVHIARADLRGIATFTLSLPSFTAGTAAIVIEAQSNRGRGELKHLIRRA